MDVPNISTPIDRQVLVRLIDHDDHMYDSTLKGFKQPEELVVARPNKFVITDPRTDKDILERASSTRLSNSLYQNLLKLIQEYNRYSIFEFNFNPNYNLEDNLRSLGHVTTMAKGLPKIVTDSPSENIFNFSRDKAIDKLLPSLNEGTLFLEVYPDRLDWSRYFVKPIDIYFGFWMIYLEKYKSVSVEELMGVKMDQWIEEVVGRLDIELCEQAIWQALLFFYGHDPIATERN